MCANQIFLQMAIVLVSLLLIYFGYEGISSGQVRIEGTYKGKRYVEKDENPFSFWTQVIIYFVVGFGGLGFVLYCQFK